jgi:hypothetical protein
VQEKARCGAPFAWLLIEIGDLLHPVTADRNGAAVLRRSKVMNDDLVIGDIVVCFGLVFGFT